MKSNASAGSIDIRDVYSGPQGTLYSLLMGQQLHIGGMKASIDLAERAGVGAGKNGIDLCCGNGGGMRVLVRFRDVSSMVGVELTPANIEKGERLCSDEGLADRIRFVACDACASGLPSGSADFIWGEDAWCYLPDKPKLIAEAARLVRPGGTIAFTDWVEGPKEMSAEEAQRALGPMNFANLEDIVGYVQLLKTNGCEVQIAEDTGRLPQFFDLSLQMADQQFTYDILATVQFRQDILEIVKENFRFFGGLGRAGKMIQARFIAQRTSRS